MEGPILKALDTYWPCIETSKTLRDQTKHLFGHEDKQRKHINFSVARDISLLLFSK